MNAFFAALWAEALKARRSKVSWLSAAGFMLLPIIGGLFMFILKDPAAAKSMGLISMKAQITAAVADWPTYFGMLTMGTAMGGMAVYSIIMTWVFGREFSDHSVKDLLAMPTPRWTIVAAKFGLTTLWVLGLTVLVFLAALGIGGAVDIPGWSTALAWSSFGGVMLTALLVFMMTPFVALLASAGRGYLPAFGWVFFTLVLAQVASAMGWGDWFPWAVPALLSRFGGGTGEPLAMHSYVVVLLACVVSLAATFAWWQSADQTR